MKNKIKNLNEENDKIKNRIIKKFENKFTKINRNLLIGDEQKKKNCSIQPRRKLINFLIFFIFNFRIFSNRIRNSSSAENKNSIMDLFSCFTGNNNENNYTLKLQRK